MRPRSAMVEREMWKRQMREKLRARGKLVSRESLLVSQLVSRDRDAWLSL